MGREKNLSSFAFALVACSRKGLRSLSGPGFNTWIRALLPPTRDFKKQKFRAPSSSSIALLTNYLALFDFVLGTSTIFDMDTSLAIAEFFPLQPCGEHCACPVFLRSCVRKSRQMALNSGDSCRDVSVAVPHPLPSFWPRAICCLH